MYLYISTESIYIYIYLKICSLFLQRSSTIGFGPRWKTPYDGILRLVESMHTCLPMLAVHMIPFRSRVMLVWMPRWWFQVRGTFWKRCSNLCTLRKSFLEDLDLWGLFHLRLFFSGHWYHEGLRKVTLYLCAKKAVEEVGQSHFSSKLCHLFWAIFPNSTSSRIGCVERVEAVRSCYLAH